MLFRIERPRKTQSATLGFKGLCDLPVKLEGEIQSSRNMSLKFMPALCPRPPRKTVHTFTGAPQGVAAANGKIAFVEGGKLHYDGAIVLTGLEAGRKALLDFGGCICIFPDRKYYNYELKQSGAIGNGEPFSPQKAGSVPRLQWACVYQNRIVGIEGHTVYASAPGDKGDFTQFSVGGEAAENGSWLLEMNNVRFTGIKEYQNRAVIFCADKSFELYGHNAANFSVQELSKDGCEQCETVCEVAGALYFLSYNGVMVYTGGRPTSVTRRLAAAPIGISAGADGRFYYLSSEGGLLVYDTQTASWIMEDDLKVYSFAFVAGKLYALTNGALICFDNGEEAVQWGFETAPIAANLPGKKRLRMLRITAECMAGSAIAVAVSEDEELFRHVGFLRSSKQEVQAFNLILRPCTSFVLQFSGRGNATIFNIERQFERFKI